MELFFREETSVSGDAVEGGWGGPRVFNKANVCFWSKNSHFIKGVFIKNGLPIWHNAYVREVTSHSILTERVNSWPSDMYMFDYIDSFTDITKIYFFHPHNVVWYMYSPVYVHNILLFCECTVCTVKHILIRHLRINASNAVKSDTLF